MGDKSNYKHYENISIMPQPPWYDDPSYLRGRFSRPA